VRKGGQNATGGSAARAQTESQAAVGEPWTGSGTVSAVDDYGLMLAQPDGSEIYVELGPPDFWQAQEVALAEGDSVSIEGFVDEDLYHAGTVTLSSGQQIALRDQYGLPLWSGGAANGRGQGNANGGGNGGNGQGNGAGNGNSGAQDGQRNPQPQAQVDEWVTVEGVISEVAQNSITVQTTDGETLVVQLGRPGFVAEQGVTFQIGDEVIVVGFYEGTQFMAGEITQVETGMRVMLRDPNGRPLWAGPGGGNGKGNGGNGGYGQGNGAGSVNGGYGQGGGAGNGGANQ
jgi:hypothetical protein